MQSSNPAFASENLLSHFDQAGSRSTTMSVAGTTVKSFVLLGLLGISAAWSYEAAGRGEMTRGLAGGLGLVALIIAFVTIARPTIAGWTAPVYAVLEGICLGQLSQWVDISYPIAGGSLAIQAVALTGCTTLGMLTLYATRIIRVTDRLTSMISAATMGICLVYLVSFVARLFGAEVPYIHSSGMIGIGFSVFVVGLAAFNLLLDFDAIEKGSQAGLPKSMEWYNAFGLMITLVWLYLEVLRLLMKLQDRRD